MMALGDSIFAGWDGTKRVADYRRIPEVIGKINGWYVNNQASTGTTFQDFSLMTTKLDWSECSLLLINYGVNDWMFGSSVDEVRSQLRSGISNVRQANSDIRIFVMCPTLDLRKGRGTTLDTPNQCGLTQDQLNDAIIAICQENRIDYHDWRKQPVITKDNSFWALGDSFTGVHPTAATSLKIGKILANEMNGGI
ncbi:SGNH/GDSL hydrolase family protein [Limosilactobacillus urinaemulieris]|nr:SGNH/GDSL hydrolase family protein [Limosilactobacillus urinaemulieris]